MRGLLPVIQYVFFPFRYPLTLFCFSFLLSVPSFLWLTLEHLQKITTSEPTTIRLFLEDHVRKEDGQKLTQDLISHDRVSHAEFITREDAWQDFEETVRLRQEYSKEDSPLPHVILVELTPEAPISDTVAKMRALDNVRFVHTGWRWGQRFYALKQVGVFVGIIFLIISLLLIYHTFSLHLAKKTPPRPDFSLCLVMGLLFGVFGASFSFGLLYGTFSYLSTLFSDSFLFNSLRQTIGRELSLGVPIGVLGALLAWRHPSSSPKNEGSGT